MTSPRLALSRATLRRMVAVLDAPTYRFSELVRVAGLDPARDFRNSVLDGVDFGTDDLSGYDFSGADLSGAVLSRATGLDGMVTDARTRLPNGLQRPPPGFDLDEVRRLILAGEAPPQSWWPFVKKLEMYLSPIFDISVLANLTALESLNLKGSQVSDVGPLAGLTALQSLALWNTPVSDVAPLAGLTALQSLLLMDTQVSDVAPLAGLSALQSLDLEGTNVSDVAAVAHVSNLQWEKPRRVKRLRKRVVGAGGRRISQAAAEP